MKVYLIVIVLTSLTASLLAQNDTSMKVLTPEEKTLVCKLTTKELQVRKKTAVAQLKKLLVAKSETEEGYSFKFPGSDDMLDLLNDFVKTERMCCNFFAFKIVVDGEFAWLELSGPSGTKDFIREELEL